MMKQKKKVRTMTDIVIGLLFVCLSIVLTIVILIPMILGILNMFLSLIKLYSMLDTPGLFFGGFIFLYIYWYVFNKLINLFAMIFNYGGSFLK